MSCRTILSGLIGLALCVSVQAMPAPDGNSVLILGPSVSGSPSMEETEAVSLGFTPVVVTGAEWSAMTSAEFGSYRAVIIGDPFCSVATTPIADAEANASTWGPSVNGPVIIFGSDPVLHNKPIPINEFIGFAGSDPLKTGAYITLSCYYHFAPALTPIPLLDAFEVGGFTAIGGSSIGGLNDIHIVATHPALTGLTDADLSNWGNSAHEGFSSWPVAFEVLAMAIDGTVGTFTAPDGTVGVPYILARGVQVLTTIDLSPDSATNPVGTSHTVTAYVEEDGSPVVGTLVTFTVVAGPNTGVTGSDTTNASGEASFSWSSAVAGTDTIEATYVTSTGVQKRSDRVTKEWIGLQAITCSAGPNDSVNEATSYMLDGSGSSGGSGSLYYLWSGTETLDDATSATPTFTAPVVSGNVDLGWTLTVSDDAGQVESCEVIITVIDSDLPPNCDGAGPSVDNLWPPNHKMVEVGVSGVVDPDDASTTLVVTGVTQDEPTNGLGDGDMSPDASFSDDTATVRAERSGLEDGRVYGIWFTASDSLGQSCSGTAFVGVPHDKKDTPIDSGQAYDSTVE